MTAVAEELQAWQSQPGWGIKAELLPPEVLAGRRATVVRRFIFLGLAALLVLCIAAWGASALGARDATAKLRAENARTTQLQATTASFNNVTQIKAAIISAQSQIAGLLGSDAKIETVMSQVMAGTPQGMLFNQLAISMTGQQGASTNSAAVVATGGGVLDTTGTAQIGTVSITAVTPRLTDVAAYLDTLAKIPGVSHPYPGPSTVGKGGVQFSVEFGLSNALLTHNYDKTKTGAN